MRRRSWHGLAKKSCSSSERSKLSSHWNRRPRLLGLQFFRGLSVDPRSTHMNTLTAVVDVLPLESGNFRKPQPCRRDQERHGAFWLPHAFQDREGLLGRKDYRFV